MGNSESKSSTEMINNQNFNIDQSVRNRIDSDCISNTKQNNVLQIIGSKVEDLTTDQVNEVKSLCILQTVLEYEKDSSVKNDVLTAISKELEAKGGLPGMGGKSESTTKIYNKMSMNIDQSQINDITKNCIMNTKQENIIQIFGSSVKGSNFNQVNKAFVECLQNHSEKTGMTIDTANKAKSELDESLTSTAPGPFDSLNSIAQIYGIVVGGIVLVCLGSSAVSAISSLGGGGGGGGGAPPPYYPGPSDMGSSNIGS